MPVSFNSPARNLFLLGSSGADAITNFFKTIDKSSNPNEGQFFTSQIKYNYSDQKYLLSGTGLGNDSFGWVEKRDYDVETDPDNPTSTEEWGFRINPTVYSSALTLTTIELDSNNDIIVVGKAGGVNGDYGAVAPYVAKYSNAGVIQWSSTSYSADVEYKNVTSDSNNEYYASGNTTSYSSNSVSFIEKFDVDGSPLWGKSAIVLGRDIELNGIAVNDRSQVVSVGWLEDDSRTKGYIVKVDTSSGTVLWDKTLVSSEKSGLIFTSTVCEDVFIDTQDNIYVVGKLDNANDSSTKSFIIKLSPEGNIVWQKETDENIEYYRVKADGDTGQVVTFGRYYDSVGNDQGGLITKYTRGGNISWRRTIFSSYNGSDFFGSGNINGGAIGLDADASFYYVVYNDSLGGQDPTAYTFGKVSTSGNGLGGFEYDDGESETVYYDILNVTERIGRLSDGSVRNDTSDLITYPFNATRITFDDYATPIANKKRQMDDAGNFEYSGSPAIRPADFQELNLLGDVYSGSGDWLDQSGKGNDATTLFTTSAIEPFAGAGSVEFDGSGDYLSLASSSDFALGTGDWTVEWFAYPTSDTQYQRHFYLQGSSATTIDGVFANPSGIAFGRTNVWATPETSHPLNQWNHYALVHDSTNMRLYLNGVEVLTTSDNFGTDATKSLNIGHSNSTYGGYFTGNISNFKIVKGTALYTASFTPPTSALTKTTGTTLLTAQGSSITDASDSNNTITVNGDAAALVSITNGPTHNAAGYWDFDGVDDRILVNNSDLHYEEMSFEWWFWNDTTQSINTYIGKRDDSSNGYMIFRYTDGKLFFDYGGFTNRWDTGWVVPNTQWVHCVLTRDSNNRKLYVNGELEATSSLAGSYIPSTLGVAIGDTSSSDSYETDGRIAEVRIYPRSLTAAQVYQNYNATKTKFIYEAPDRAPKIGPGLSAASSLLLNYDFGHRGTYDSAATVNVGENRYTSSFNLTKFSDGTANGVLTDWSWLGSTTPSITPYVTTAPDGSKTATLITGASASIYQSIVNDSDFTISAWVKTVDGSSQSFQQSVYLLNTGGELLYTTHTATGDWQRFTFSGVATSEWGSPAGEYHRYTPFASTADLYVWGPQVELKSSASSYVPTYGTAAIPGVSRLPNTVKNLSRYPYSSYTGTLDGATFNSNGYMELDSRNSVINAGPANLYSGNNVSFEMWFYPETTAEADSRSMMLTANYESPGFKDGTVILRYDQEPFGTARMFIAQVQVGTTDEFWQHSTQYPRDNWYHVVWTWNNGTMKLYINGSEKTLDTNTGGPTSGAILNNFGNIYIGENDTYGGTVIGDYGQLRIYTKTLSATEVSQNFNATRGKYGV